MDERERPGRFKVETKAILTGSATSAGPAAPNPYLDAIVALPKRKLIVRSLLPVVPVSTGTRGAANTMLRCLHIIFKWAGKRQTGLIDPTRGIEEYEATPYEPWPDHLLDAALASADIHFRTAVALHLYTGQRTGDVCAMTWNALTAHGRIPVRQQKTKAHLLVPVHPALADALAAAPRGALTMLTNKLGQPLQRGIFLQWVRRFATAHNVHLVPHGLRKNAVNGLLEAGCSTAEVSSITGQSLGMVEHYAKQRNQGRIAIVAMGKWGAARTENGKTLASEENSGRKVMK